MRKMIPALVGLALVCLSSVVWAGFANPHSLVIGDLHAGLGGAATAVEGDSSGSPYYNPATLALQEGSAFSAAVGVYKKFDILYGQEEDFTKAPLRVNQGFFRSLPASTGNVIRWNKLPDWTLAFSVVVPDYEQFKGDLKTDATTVSTLTYTDESLWVGGSMARQISDRQSLGLTLYYTARNLVKTVNDRSTPDANRTRVYSLERTQTENAILPIFGYHYRLNNRWSWGLSARLRSLKIAGRATLFESDTQVDSGGTPPLQVTSSNNPELAARVVIPGRLAAGLAFRPDPSWLISFDASVHEGISYDDLENSNLATRIRHKSVWNYALGLEKWALDWLKLRAGLYTNFSTHPDPDPNLLRLQEDHVDMLGFSANFVFIAGQRISYTFGGYYTGGKGRSMQRINHAYTVVPKTVHVFTMLVGTSFSF